MVLQEMILAKVFIQISHFFNLKIVWQLAQYNKVWAAALLASWNFYIRLTKLVKV